MLGLDETDGARERQAPQPFFRSRWVERAGARARAARRRPAARAFAPPACAGGIKPSGRARRRAARLRRAGDDERRALHALGRARRAGARSRATRCRLDGLRAVAANSGNANAATGERGLDAAAKMQGAAACGRRGSRRPGRGRLDRRDRRAARRRARSLAGIARPPPTLRRDGDADFAAAIMTTDAFEKRATLEVELPDGAVHAGRAGARARE